MVGGGAKGVEAQGLLYRATDASLAKFDYVAPVLTANRTVGFGKNGGFFDSAFPPGGVCASAACCACVKLYPSTTRAVSL